MSWPPTYGISGGHLTAADRLVLYRGILKEWLRYFERVYALPILGLCCNPTVTVISIEIANETWQAANENFRRSAGRSLRVCSMVVARDGSRAGKAMQGVSGIFITSVLHLLRGTVVLNPTRKSPILPTPSTVDFQKRLRCRHHPFAYPWRSPDAWR